MNILHYFLVLIAAFLVDTIPFIGPPAWTVMVFFQVRYGLDIWLVLIIGVVGSAVGRYVYSLYVPLLSTKILNQQKNEDVRFIGRKLDKKSWQVQAFVVLYTLMPLPSTPLFTAAGIAGLKTIQIMPAFFIGKFASDALMVFAGDYVAQNAADIVHGLLSWKSIFTIIVSLFLVFAFLFIDWRTLLQKNKFRFDFNIWK